jgi:hypothetical protein
MNHASFARLILEDNPLLSKKIEKAADVLTDEVETLLTEVLRFMELTVIAAERLTPSHIVDFAWHEFILFTRYYADFCETQFGRFVHHHPGGNESENRICFKKTHYYYQKTYDEVPNPKYWGNVLAEIADASDCGV